MPTSNTFVDRVVNEIAALGKLWKDNKVLFGVVLVVGVFALSLVSKPLFDSFEETKVVDESTSTHSEILTRTTQPQSAEEALRMGQYSLARDMYKDMSLRAPDDAVADDIRGMVTATYYGEGLHQEGLEYICEQYKFKTKDSRAFLFGVHAHIRALSVNSGAALAEQVASKMRAECHRSDFSEFWVYIPFGMMESLRIGTPRSLHNWALTKEEKRKLSLWLSYKRKKEIRKNPAFADYALYFLDQFDEVLADYPKSSIREVVLFDAAELSVVAEKRIKYLKKFISEYPRSRHFEHAVSSLVMTLEKLGRRNEALRYVSKIKDSHAASSIIDLRVTEPTARAISSFVRKGELKSALKLSKLACRDFKENKLSCPGEIEDFENKIQKAIGYSKLKFISLTCSRVQLRIRRLAERTGRYKDIDWRYAARSYLVDCIERIQDDAEDYARSLYLISSLSRRVSDYKTSIEYLLRFRREIRGHELLDDVICEIGYHHLFIDRNWEKAKLFFSEVVDKYPNKNAYDNALWWYGIGSKNTGDFIQAIPAFAKIGVLESQSRFRRWSSSEHEKLIRMVSQEPFVGISFKLTTLNDEGLFVSDIKSQSSFAKALLKGDRLLRICGARVYGVDDLLDASQRSNIASCEIEFLRGNSLLRFAADRTGVWAVEKEKLTGQQLEDMAFESILKFR